MAVEISTANEITGTPVRLKDALKRPDARGREVETAIALAMQQVLASQKRAGVRMSAPDALRGLLGNLVAVIFARASGLTEAREVAEIVCAEIMSRVTEH